MLWGFMNILLENNLNADKPRVDSCSFWPRFTSFYCCSYWGHWCKESHSKDRTSKNLFIFIHFVLIKSFLISGKVGGLTDLSNLIKLRGHPEGGLGISSHGILSHMDRGSAPQWTVQPPNELSFSNSSGAKLECMASGNPQPTIEWFQEDQLIAQNLHGLRMVMPNGTLYFPAFT